MSTVTIKAPTIPVGAAVRAYPLRLIDWERRHGRVPMVASATDDGVIDSAHEVEITGDAGKYALLAVVNEVQTVTIDATGGTFTLTYSGQTTGNIAFDATAAAVQTALEALSNLAPGDVTVTGSAGGPYTVTFGGTLAGQDVAALTGDDTLLTGGAGTVVIATTTEGAPSTTGEKLWVIFSIDE